MTRTKQNLQSLSNQNKQLLDYLVNDRVTLSLSFVHTRSVNNQFVKKISTAFKITFFRHSNTQNNLLMCVGRTFEIFNFDSLAITFSHRQSYARREYSDRTIIRFLVVNRNIRKVILRKCLFCIHSPLQCLDQYVFHQARTIYE